MGLCWTKIKNLSSSKASEESTDDDSKPDLAGGNVRFITTMEMWETETSEANKDGKVMVVNFSASWCTPCKQIAPTYRELADKYSSVLFLSVDVDELSELTSTWDVQATPSFFFLRDGLQLDKLVGAKKAELEKKTMAIAG